MGELCKILFDMNPEILSYTIFDLSPVVKLIRKYLSKILEKSVFEKIVLIPVEETSSWELSELSDLVISNYAYSECSKAIREKYLQEVIVKSSCGYLTMNQMLTDGDQRIELVEKFKGIKIIGFSGEVPLTSARNYLAVWK